jgi:alcohol dehydrogenase (NADP+)
MDTTARRSTYYMIDPPTPSPVVSFTEAAMFNEHQLREVIKTSIQEGFRHIDCAKLYSGLPEELIGQALQEAMQQYNVDRQDIFITCQIKDISNFTTHVTKHVLRQCKKSLKNLKLDYIDLYLVSYVADEDSFRLIWSAMESLVDKGLVKSIGVTDVSMLDIMDMLQYARIRPVCPYPSTA